MSVAIRNFVGQNMNLNVVEQIDNFSVIEHLQDLSVSPSEAQTKFYMSQMNCLPRQLFITLNNAGVKLAKGVMQFYAGDVACTTGVTGAGDYLAKVMKSKVTKDSAIKPLYKGTGYVMCEPTYKYILLEEVGNWNGMVCDDGMFMACQDTVQDTVVMRDNVSAGVAGGKGWFNTCLQGRGVAAIKSPCPREELYEIYLNDDVIRIDGKFAICWSQSLKFTVERAGATLIGSAASGEGLVNVYRGTGKILMSPGV